MSFNLLMKEWAEAALPPHASFLLKAMESPLSDATYKAIEPVLGGGAVMKEAIMTYPVMAANKVHDAFIISLHSSVMKLAPSVTLTDKQARAVSNVLRCALRDGDPGTYQAPAPSSSASTTSPAYAPYDKNSKSYVCFACKVQLIGIDALYEHRMQVHGIKPPASYKGPVVSTPAPSVPAPVPTVLAKFTPKLNLDLSVLPSDGRYALEPTPSNGLTSPWFVLIKQVKRPYSRRGRFIWGVNRRGYGEYIEKGRWEVRVQVGDTKDLIGEQKQTGSVYHGEQEELLQEVLNNPAEAMMRYGVLLGRCSYCGRSLTDDLSRLRGIGPDCWEAKHMPFVMARAKTIMAMSATVKP